MCVINCFKKTIVFSSCYRNRCAQQEKLFFNDLLLFIIQSALHLLFALFYFSYANTNLYQKKSCKYFWDCLAIKQGKYLFSRWKIIALYSCDLSTFYSFSHKNRLISKKIYCTHLSPFLSLSHLKMYKQQKLSPQTEKYMMIFIFLYFMLCIIQKSLVTKLKSFSLVTV